MKKFLPGAVSRRLMAAVVAGTALSAAGDVRAASHRPADQAVQDISRYCQVCWRNARLDPASWPDCTQEVLVRLLQTVEPDKWAGLLKQDENDDRREFLRAIDAVKKRTQRARKASVLADDVADRRFGPEATRNELHEELDRASRKVLSQRQQQILRLTCDGWSVPEIADELSTTVERVSDEKYKAIRKLRKELHS
jgi:RNA polymerase sigma factor (sigma-70 family)